VDAAPSKKGIYLPFKSPKQLLMGDYTDNIAKKLNSLLKKNHDAEKGFGKASKKATAKSLMEWFNERAVDRHRFAKELKETIASLGQPIVTSGSLSGTVHRTWMDLKTFLAANTDGALLEEAIRGERAALEEYRDVLTETVLPPTLASLLESHKQRMEEGLAVLENLENIEFERE
jgi:uncharacterized protein (TIGR02284 family)